MLQPRDNEAFNFVCILDGNARGIEFILTRLEAAIKGGQYLKMELPIDYEAYRLLDDIRAPQRQGD